MTFDERVKRSEECEEDENHIQRKKIAYSMHFEDKRLRAEYSRDHKYGYCPKCFLLKMAQSVKIVVNDRKATDESLKIKTKPWEGSGRKIQIMAITT